MALFKAYDIRGIVPDELDAKKAYAIGRATAHFIAEGPIAVGRDALSAMKVGVYMMQQGDYITEHELVIASKLAHVLTGGNISQPTWVDEQYILDLEREAFLSLCGEDKTQQRMWSLLQTGKVLRN